MINPGITPIKQLEAIRQHLRQNHTFSGKTVHEIRIAAENSARQLPVLSGMHVERVGTDQFSGEWVRAGRGTGHSGLNPELRGTGVSAVASERKVILYYHGGGFVAGSCASYRDLAARLSEVCGIAVFTVEYRLAPEFHYPAANEDCLAAYRWLLEQGVLPGNIILGGDSVGATIVLMTLITLRDEGDRLPAGACLLSPHTDLVHLDGESYESRAELDPTGNREGNRRILEDYLGDYAGERPALLSPLRMDLGGLPPLFIQVGDQEVLLSDAERLAEQARAAGNQVSLEVWENMWCSFQVMAGLLPEAALAIRHLGNYIRSTLMLEAAS